jgi:hypothetical protein
MGQGGNVWEWSESALDGTNNSVSEDRLLRGGNWTASAFSLGSTGREFSGPAIERDNRGFRVASVDVAPIPEPGTWAAMAIFAGGAAFAGWRRRKSAKVAA